MPLLGASLLRGLREVVRAARRRGLSLFIFVGRGCLPRALAKPTPTRNEPEANWLTSLTGCSQQNQRQLSTTDILAPVTMKNAAKCDT